MVYMDINEDHPYQLLSHCLPVTDREPEGQWNLMMSDARSSPTRPDNDDDSTLFIHSL